MEKSLGFVKGVKDIYLEKENLKHKDCLIIDFDIDKYKDCLIIDFDIDITDKNLLNFVSGNYLNDRTKFLLRYDLKTDDVNTYITCYFYENGSNYFESKCSFSDKEMFDLVQMVKGYIKNEYSYLEDYSISDYGNSLMDMESFRNNPYCKGWSFTDRVELKYGDKIEIQAITWCEPIIKALKDNNLWHKRFNRPIYDIEYLAIDLSPEKELLGVYTVYDTHADEFQPTLQYIPMSYDKKEIEEFVKALNDKMFTVKFSDNGDMTRSYTLDELCINGYGEKFDFVCENVNDLLKEMDDIERE